MRRLPRDAVDFIKSAQTSYSQIILNVQKQWNRHISKGLVSYYRGKKTGRTKQLYREKIDQHEWDWLVGLYYADGCKFKDKYHHIIAFTLASGEIEIQNKLVSILDKTGLKARISPVRGEKATDIRVCNKYLYLTLPDKGQKYFPNSSLAYLAGLFDGDGHIKKHPCGEKWVFSQAKYPNLVKQVVSIAQKYGKVTVSLQQRKDNKSKPVYRVSFLREARRVLSRNEFSEYSVRCKLEVGRAGFS